MCPKGPASNREHDSGTLAAHLCIMKGTAISAVPSFIISVLSLFLCSFTLSRASAAAAGRLCGNALRCRLTFLRCLLGTLLIASLESLILNFLEPALLDRF